MKKIIFVLALIMSAVAVNAQITWNVKAGVGMSKLTGASGEMKFGWKIGVGVEKPLSENWLIMPTLEFKQKGSESPLSNDVDWKKVTISSNYIQLPILVAYRIRLTDEVNMTLKAGPYFAYGVSGEIKYELVEGGSEICDLFDSEWEDENANRFDAGVVFGADFEYHRYVCGIECEYGLTNVFDYEEVYPTNRNMSIYVTIGYKF